MGLRVGGKLSGGAPLVDAQLVGYVNSTLRFRASAAAAGGPTNMGTASYKYGVYLLFNLGYGAYASVKFFPNWALKPRNAFNPPKQFTIYENSGSFTGPTKRALDTLHAVPAPKFPRGRLIGGWLGAELSAIDQYHQSSHHDSVVPLMHNKSSAMSMRSLLAKRVDDDALPDAPNAVSTAQLQCPAGNTPDIRLPDYRRKFLVIYMWLSERSDDSLQSTATFFRHSKSMALLAVLELLLGYVLAYKHSSEAVR